jgi:hypothetical protein
MADSKQAATKTSTTPVTLPLIYRFFFLFFEPIMSLVGAYYAYFGQEEYLRLSHAASAPSTVPKGTSIAMSQLANMYLFFALNEALVLRSTSDIRVWKTVLFCLLVGDLGHLWTVSQAGMHLYWSPWQWNAIDWGNIPFVYFGASMRIAFLADVGLGLQGKKLTKKRTA